MYDFNRDGCIDWNELRTFVQTALEEADVHLPDSVVDTICKNTVKTTDLNENGIIDFVEYENLVKANPRLLLPFTIDIDELVQSSCVSLEEGKEICRRKLRRGQWQHKNRFKKANTVDCDSSRDAPGFGAASKAKFHSLVRQLTSPKPKESVNVRIVYDLDTLFD